MDNLYLIMFLGLSFFILLLFFYILKVEKTFEDKLNSFEITLENINRDIFFLKKELKRETPLEEIKKIEHIIDSIVDDLRILENKHLKLINGLKEEISTLNSKIKKNNIPDMGVINKTDEEKILNLYKDGYSIEDISKTLRIPAGEVEFIVKFSSNS